MAFVLLRTDLIVAVSVNQLSDMRNGRVSTLLLSSFSIPLPGSTGLYILLSAQCTPMMKVVMVSWGELVAGVVWESKFVDCFLFVITCGGACCETGVIHG